MSFVRMLEVSLNGARRELEVGTTIAELVAELHPTSRGVAVALNEQVVPRSLWASTPLSSRDRVEVLTPAQGG